MQHSKTLNLNYKLLNKWKVTFTMQMKKTIQHWLTLKAEEMEGKIHYDCEESNQHRFDQMEG